MKFYNNTIGGFFEFEIGSKQPKKKSFHFGALPLSSGRACLNFICKTIVIKLVYVPFYSCNSLLMSLIENDISYKFYSINDNLEISTDINLEEEEYIIYINYFGLKTNYCSNLISVYGEKLILDNTQAFFLKGNKTNWSFNSARKFFGVPDGAFLYGPDLKVKNLERNPFYQCNHLLERKFGNQQESYKKFIAYEKTIKSDIYNISFVSEKLLNTLNMYSVMEARKSNFKMYQQVFKSYNLLHLGDQLNETPFVYPLLLNKVIKKTLLYEKNIFIPILWNDVIQRNEQDFDFEKKLCNHLLPLPIDHRYGKKECKIVINAIQKLI